MKTREQWVRDNWSDAVQVTNGTGIFPQTLMAMAIVESQGNVNGTWYPGQGLVARTANNYFGIKDSAQWTGPTITLPTPGDANSISTFRKYNSFKASMADFVNFLKTNPRYTTNGVFNANDYVEQIAAIAKAGYAENSQYQQLVTNVASKLKTYLGDLEQTFNNNKGMLPILIAAFIVAMFLVTQNTTSNERI
jgi:N-acetylmuramoyl-L-alanine amidase